MTQKTQKSLLWIISAIYLTMVFSGGVLATIFTYAGAIFFVGAPYVVSLSAILLLQLAGYLLGLKIGINFARNRAFIEQKDYFKISAIVATIPIVFLLIFSKGLRFELINLAVILDSLIIFYSAKYFLEKGSENTKNTQSSPKIWIAVVAGIFLVAGVCCWQYSTMQKEIGMPEGIPAMMNEAKTTPSITVTYPNGKEELVAGETYQITWDSVEVEEVDIELLEFDSHYNIIGDYIGGAYGEIVSDGRIENKGYYNWTIPKDILDNPVTNPRHFKISIRQPFDEPGIIVSDISDDYFSIVVE